ncbi:copper chaperone PCu(A)C [Glacieibacterium frigidum]|uniref:Copper chaperone PCu(A)C n=1 Tax=Glacieibacterium frigidum TaxID=2593303 RepID=A0A552UEX8_9SPHN|nr:copper chaperone PCu(A)C [Glacieibacterium frigidum]TRW16773.1 copper chaperone PCu(A)C [Glacieibacterium frigidum]
MATTFNRALGWTACAAAVMLLIASLLLSARADAAETSVSAATIRLPAVAGRPAAGYLTIRAGDAPVVVTGAETPMASRVELHGTSMAGGVMRMNALPEVRVAAGQTGGFTPGGNHLMIFGLRRDVKPGATVPITLRLAGGKTMRVDAVAVAAGAAIADPHAGHGAH